MKFAAHTFFLVLAITISTIAGGNDLLPVGSEAKTFLILDPDGKRVGLRDFVGPKAAEKPALVVLSFWSLTCVPCRTEMPLLQAWADKHPDAKLLFLSVDPKSDQDKVVAHMKEHNFKAPVLLDFYQATGKNYGVCQGQSCNVPALFAIGPDGMVRLAISGFDENRNLEAELDAALAGGVAAVSTQPTVSTLDSQRKFQVLHDALKSLPLDETARRNGVSREQLIDIFREAESAAKKGWNLQQ